MNFMLLIFILASSSELVSSDQNIQACYKSNAFNQNWILHSEDNFFGDRYNLSLNWNINHETSVPCLDHGQTQMSCSVRDNAHQSHGYLILSAKQELNMDNYFTGVTIRSVERYRHGRFEIRARQPVGKLIHTRIFLQSLITTNGSHDIIDIAHNFQGTKPIKRGIRINNKYNVSNLINADNKEDMNIFHTYGLEWLESLEEIRFFFDDSYSEHVMKFKESSSSGFQLVIQIKVGARNTKGKSHFNDLNWQRPALIVDYVKVYQLVSRNDIENISKCVDEFNSYNSDNFFENSRMINGELPEFDSTKQNSVTQFNQKQMSTSGNIGLTIIIVLIGMVLLCTISIVYIRFEFNKVKKDVRKDSDKFWVQFSTKTLVETLESDYDQINENEIMDELSIEEKESISFPRQKQSTSSQLNHYAPIAIQHNAIYGNDATKYENI